MAKTGQKSFSLGNSSQKPLFFAVLMYSLYSHPRYLKFNGLSTTWPVFPDNLSISYDYGNTKHGYKSRKTKCVSCNNYTDKATAIKNFTTGGIFEIRRDGSCQTKNIIYVAYHLNCQKHGVGSIAS